METVAAPQTISSQPVTLRIGTRTSKLALWQSEHVAAMLQARWPHVTCELVHLVTQGDKRLDRPLPEIGGKGLFTAELEDALRRGEIDLAVHSLKDLPVENAPELILGAVLSREDTRDVLVAREGWTLATLPNGAVVGTSSLRRQAQLLAVRPDLNVRSIRGNVDTRLRKVFESEYDAAVMAGAGLTRLGLTAHITEWLPVETMVPAPGQGALAVQCRSNDANVLALLAAIHDPIAATTTMAERHLLQRLGGGCSAPIGASARVDAGVVTLRARVTSVDGRQVFDAEATGGAPDAVAQAAVATLLAKGAAAALTRERVVAGANDDKALTPLRGKRVVITRPQVVDGGEEDELVRGLRAAGAMLIHIPAIRLSPVLDESALHAIHARLHDYDWLIFTSAQAVTFFWQGDSAPNEAARSGLLRIAAVGPATHAALQARGLAVAAMPETYRGDEIVNVLGEVSGKRILLPRSQQGNPALPDGLRRAGANVDEVSLYNPVATTIDESARSRLLQHTGGADANTIVTFASGSAVRAFVGSLCDDGRFDDFWRHAVIACIGPSTAEAVEREGLHAAVVAQEHTMNGLVEALMIHYRDAVSTETKG